MRLYPFDKNLFHRALTHSSYANEHKKDKAVCNERLEFWVMPFWKWFPVISLNITSTRRSRRESSPRSVPAWCASRPWLTVQPIWSWAAICFWERARRPPAEESVIPVVSDAMEALIGSIYLDGGLANAKRVHSSVYSE